MGSQLVVECRSDGGIRFTARLVAVTTLVVLAAEKPDLVFAEESTHATSDVAQFEELVKRTEQVYKEQRLNEAVEVAKQTLAFAEAHFSHDDLKLATALFNLGGLYQYRVDGKEKEGKELIDRARAIRAKHGLSTNPLGLHTEAFFDAISIRKGAAQFHSGDAKVSQWYDPRKSCDLDMDGDCDTEDLAVFDASLGRCFADFRTVADTEADADGDGCITATDRRALFPGQSMQLPDHRKSSPNE